MTALPIAERELRVAARSPRTYWSRALAALAVIVLSVMIFNSYDRFASSKAGGHQLFSALAYLTLAYSLFAGTALTADCLSCEKRQDTLGLLFLTDLKGYDVVLGKLAATSLRSIYGHLAIFPVMFLPLFLGGVKAAEFWRVILAVLNTLLLSLAMGLLVSTLFRKQRVTTHLAALLMLLLAVVPFGVSQVANTMVGGSTLPVDPGLLSPIYTLWTAFDANYRLTTVIGSGFWEALAVQFTVAILLLARASWLLPRTWQENVAPTATSRALPPGVAHPQEDSWAPRRRVRDENPFYWLASRGSGMTIGLTVLIGLVGLWGILAWNDREDFAAAQGVGILLVALVTRLLIAVAAAQRFAEDKESGALDLILTTPLTLAELFEGQWRATAKKLGKPFLASLVLYAFLIFGAPQGNFTTGSEATAAWFTAACFFLITLADAVALSWLGMWAGVSIRQVPHGAALCLLKVVVPPAVVPLAFIWNHGVTSADEYIKTNPFWIPALWLGLALATDLAWTLWSRQKLGNEFRAAAAERFQRRGVVRWWWRR